MRCAERKFRTPSDLALHILSKHGHVQLTSQACEDARSITLSSPFLAKDAEELDQMIATAAKTSHGTTTRTVTTETAGAKRTPRSRALKGTSASKRPKPVQQKRRRIQRKSIGSSATLEESPGHSALRSSTDESNSRDMRESKRRHRQPAAEGESIGPRAQDVYIARCRSGQVPLVPSHRQPSATLDFATGLF